MNKEQSDVKSFMLKAGQECPAKPTIPSREVRILRIKLIAEELRELCEAFNCRLYADASGDSVWCDGDNVDLVAAADATTDLKIVVIGTDVAMGIDNEPCWDAVHENNMKKFEGGFKRPDGKFMKPPGFLPVDLKPIIEAQSK